MTNYKGTIIILSKHEDISDIKKYDGIARRNRIIKDWIKKYKLQNKIYYLIIQPNEIFDNKKTKFAGVITLSLKDKEDVDMKVYTSIANRDAIIEQWKEKYSEIILKIKPL